MTALNPILFPNENDGNGDVTHPIIAADHKRACLKRFEADTPAYEKLAHLLPEMLSLYDLIRSDARDRYNDTGKGKRGGRLRIITGRKVRQGGKSVTMDNGAVLPVPQGRAELRQAGHLPAHLLRHVRDARRVPELHRRGRGRNVQWKGGFESVTRAWKELGAELVITCQDHAEQMPEHKMAVLLGRNRPLWNGLHKIVREYLTRQESDQKTSALEEKAAALQAEVDRLLKLSGGSTPTSS